MARFTITMTRSKETKGTFAYSEDDNAEGQPPRIGTLYIKKWAANPLGERSPSPSPARPTPKADGRADTTDNCSP